jgi:hypothetical protein
MKHVCLILLRGIKKKKYINDYQGVKKNRPSPPPPASRKYGPDGSGVRGGGFATDWNFIGYFFSFFFLTVAPDLHILIGIYGKNHVQTHPGPCKPQKVSQDKTP